jgi:hypothetical protein
MGYVLTDMKSLEKSSLWTPFHFTINDNTKDYEIITHHSNYIYHHCITPLALPNTCKAKVLMCLVTKKLVKLIESTTNKTRMRTSLQNSDTQHIGFQQCSGSKKNHYRNECHVEKQIHRIELFTFWRKQDSLHYRLKCSRNHCHDTHHKAIQMEIGFTTVRHWRRTMQCRYAKNSDQRVVTLEFNMHLAC